MRRKHLRQTANEPECDYPLVQMNQGDSFFIPTLEPKKITKEVKLKAKELQIKVIIKSCIYDEILGLRVWRT